MSEHPCAMALNEPMPLITHLRSLLLQSQLLSSSLPPSQSLCFPSLLVFALLHGSSQSDLAELSSASFRVTKHGPARLASNIRTRNMLLLHHRFVQLKNSHSLLTQLTCPSFLCIEQRVAMPVLGSPKKALLQQEASPSSQRRYFLTSKNEREQTDDPSLHTVIVRRQSCESGSAGGFASIYSRRLLSGCIPLSRIFPWDDRSVVVASTVHALLADAESRPARLLRHTRRQRGRSSPGRST